MSTITSQQLDAEWRDLDFQQEVRPAQLQKLQQQRGQIAQIGLQLQQNNDQNLAQIDQSYKETTDLEIQFIAKKMENMNLINESELEGIKFLQQFGQCTRETESLNNQINQIEQVIAMLKNEISQADFEITNMNEVYEQEQQLLYQREVLIREDDKFVAADIKDQIQSSQATLSEIESVQTKQLFIHENLSNKQQQVIEKLEKQSLELEQERETLQKEREDLQVQLRNSQRENEERKNKNLRLEHQITQLNLKIEVMEDNLDKIVFENVEQFESYQEIIAENNLNIGGIRQDLGRVQKQYFEMENINECLEQRIEQLKCQRDLSIKLLKAGWENDLKSEQMIAVATNQKLINLLNNTELSWDDKLVIKMRELDDAMKQSSEESINTQVQTYLQNVKDTNEEIVKINQQKEQIESKMRNEIEEQELKELQKEHSALIKKYEDIIRQKIEIFSQMINNLKQISEGNSKFIKNEEKIADQKLSIEIWDRDIYQKKRVSLDIGIEIQNAQSQIDQIERQIQKKQQLLSNLQKQLEDAEAEYNDFKNDELLTDQHIKQLQAQIRQLKDEKARLEAEESERKRLEDELKKNQPKPKMKYQPIKGDKVDEKMAVFINNFELDVPLLRVGDGQYMFGSRKVFAKIMNDKLVIRVGGGFMLIDEFLQTYGQQEMDRINILAQREQQKGSFVGQVVGGSNQTDKNSPVRQPSPSTQQAQWQKAANVGGRLSPTAANRASPNQKRQKF